MARELIDHSTGAYYFVSISVSFGDDCVVIDVRKSSTVRTNYFKQPYRSLISLELFNI